MKMRNVLFLLQVISVFQNFSNSSDTTSLDRDANPKKRKAYFKWTPEMQNALTEICRKIPSDEPYYFERVRKKWYELYPNYNVSDRTLRRKLHRIPNDITGRTKRLKREFKWDDKKDKELVDIYLNSRPYNKFHPVDLREEWERRHPGSPRFMKSYLSARSREYLNRHPSHVKGESSKRLFEWTDKHDSDLFHIHHITLPEGKSQPIHMHRIWTDLHPDLRDLTHDQMLERMNYLRKNPPNKHFPWTNEQNQELLRIYHRTDPEVADQGQRIYDVWTKIHPRYKFMTPYYLQIHASTLAHHEETIFNKKKVIKFSAELKTNLADMYRRLAEPGKSLYGFHRAWVREYPSLAHLTTRSLSMRVKNLTPKDDSPNVGVTGEEQFETPKSRHQKYCKYTAEQKAKLLATYRETYPHEYGHGNRILDKWVKEHEEAYNIKGSSLRQLIQNWIKEDSDRKGKAPILKVEENSESSS